VALSAQAGTKVLGIIFYFYLIKTNPEPLFIASLCVADPGYQIPDPEFCPSQLSDPGSKNSNKREG
jgi:hypothetical protein